MNPRETRRHDRCFVVLAMDWERRLREMILASGALAATACGGSTTAKAGIDADAVSDHATAETGSTCCNPSGDPCCSLTCEGLPPPSYDACELGQQQCEAMHGTFTLWAPDSFTCDQPLPRPSPSEAGVDDVGTPDAGLADATEYAALDAAAESGADADLVDAGADADSCPPSGGCTAACVAGRHNVTVMVDGCPVTECCVPDDAGTD